MRKEKKIIQDGKRFFVSKGNQKIKKGTLHIGCKKGGRRYINLGADAKDAFIDKGLKPVTDPKYDKQVYDKHDDTFVGIKIEGNEFHIVYPVPKTEDYVIVRFHRTAFSVSSVLLKEMERKIIQGYALRDIPSESIVFRIIMNYEIEKHKNEVHIIGSLFSSQPQRKRVRDFQDGFSNKKITPIVSGNIRKNKKTITRHNEVIESICTYSGIKGLEVSIQNTTHLKGKRIDAILYTNSGEAIVIEVCDKGSKDKDFLIFARVEGKCLCIVNPKDEEIVKTLRQELESKKKLEKGRVKIITIPRWLTSVKELEQTQKDLERAEKFISKSITDDWDSFE